MNKPKRIICDMCEAHGAGPCEECDRLNAANDKCVLVAIAKEHRRCETFYRNAKGDPHGINTALMIMHADTATIYEKLNT